MGLPVGALVHLIGIIKLKLDRSKGSKPHIRVSNWASSMGVRSSVISDSKFSNPLKPPRLKPVFFGLHYKSDVGTLSITNQTLCSLIMNNLVGEHGKSVFVHFLSKIVVLVSSCQYKLSVLCRCLHVRSISYVRA